MSHAIAPDPRTCVLCPLSPSIEVASPLVGTVMKLVSVGVNEHNAPVSMTMGSLLGFVDI